MTVPRLLISTYCDHIYEDCPAWKRLGIKPVLENEEWYRHYGPVDIDADQHGDVCGICKRMFRARTKTSA